MNKKYQIGQKYLLKVFLESEEMEYLGEIKMSQYNGSTVAIAFDVFRRWSFGREDLFALHNGEFFVRSYKNTIEDLVKAVGNTFCFEGKGHAYVSVGNIALCIQEFRNQTFRLLTESQIEEAILKGRYLCVTNNQGEIKWCPQCQKIRQTTCVTCGCGGCVRCNHKWTCMPAPIPIVGLS